MEDRLMTVTEVAKQLNVHIRTVQRMLIRGELKGVKVAARWRISPTELRRYLEERSKPSK